MKRRAVLFKKVGGHYVRFRGNPLKKHIVRGRNPFKRNIASGHYDATGKFHRRKNIAGFYDDTGFHPIRAGTYPGGKKAGVKYSSKIGDAKARARAGKKKSRKRKSSRRKKR